MSDANSVSDELMEKIKKVAKDLVPFTPLDRCKEGIHSDRCVNISGGKIWWKCVSCGRVTSQDDLPFTGRQ